MSFFNIPPKQTNMSSYEDPRDHASQQVRDFLRKISFLESSYGQNTNHPTMQTGINAGTHAVGEYGLMPITAQDLANKSGMSDLKNLDKQQVQDKLENDPDMQTRLAQTMASHLLSRNPAETASYKWEQGQYSKPNEDDLENSQRVKRFRVLQNAK